MKTAKIIPIAILCLMISVTLAVATNTATVTMSPNSWAKSTKQGVSLTVTNTGGDTISEVDLIVPLDSNQVPLYSVSAVTTPGGWTPYLTTQTIGQATGQVSKIAWTSGTGIVSGSSVIFGITATSPSTSGNYLWSWTAGTATGTVTTTIGQAPVSYFVISGVPATSNAGNSIKFNVRAYGNDNQIKTDYTGTITFSSTDINAILPSDYTFKSSDYGSKDFAIIFKSSGSQSFTIKDSSAAVSKTSISTQVNLGTATAIGIMPESKQISVGGKIQFSVVASDNYNNLFDVTKTSTITIDKKAGGSWNGSTFTSQNDGTWVVIASYKSLVAGTTLTVTTGATVPSNETPVTINITVPEANVTPEETPSMELTLPEMISIAPGANDTVIVTVNNNGNTDLKNVEISVDGVPSSWINVYPLANDIPAKNSKDYLVIMLVPSNESNSKSLVFTATSGSVTASKNATLTITSAPTGSFTMPKNILQLGVVIIAVAAVVIIGWELWFRKPKSK